MCKHHHEGLRKIEGKENTMSVTAAAVKDLRERTGAGMMDCKKALTESGGDIDKAIDILRKMGLKDVSKRSGKVAAEGTIGIYLHAGDRIGAMVELNCETDFVGRGDEFRQIAKNIAMHVAALKPMYLTETDVPEEVLSKEREIGLETLNDKQKEKADVILEGRIKKWKAENVLLNQAYILDDSGKKSVQDVLNELGAKVGENVTLRRMQCFEVGEGIEKQSQDYASEVAETIAAV